MFTGIITDIGRIRSIETRGDTLFVIETAYDAASIALGASIACGGPCLTVVRRGADGGKTWFAVEVSAETMSKTTAGSWREGTRLNLERSLKVGDELGGHIVSGHVDGLGRIESLRQEGDSWRFRFSAPGELMRYIARKGSIALDGVSLTVNEVDDEGFGVNIIPHTFAATTFGERREGDDVNLEIDTLARYIERMRQVS